MQVLHYKPKFEQDWNQYLEDKDCSTFYHKIEWKSIIEKSFNHDTYYLLGEEKGSIKGLLPLIHSKSRLFGSVISSMPFLNFGGILADNQQAEELLQNESRKILNKVNADYIELRHKNKSHLNLRSNTHKVSMMVELAENPETLWKNYSSKHRNNIRKSLKSDLEFKIGHLDMLNDFYYLISEGWKNHGTPIYKKDFFYNILETFNDQVEVCAVYLNQKIVAVAFNGLYKDTIEGMWTYSFHQYNNLNINYFLYWKMLENACKRGFKKFHLGRSTKDSPAVQYKKKWNAVPVQLYWEYIMDDNKPLPELNVDNPKYKILINTWRKLPLKLTQTVGPYFAKNIP